MQADSLRERAGAKIEEKNLRFSKKVLDKQRTVRYNNQAFHPEREEAECTLKIEQCKKKLMLNKHQKRVQVLRDTLTKISFES